MEHGRQNADLNPELVFLYDPMCGWCYAVEPIADALASKFGRFFPLRLIHAGLFARDGARRVTADFARYAWENDERIAALTGQPFSVEYKERVLGDPSVPMNSWLTAIAMQVVHAYRPELEMRALRALQRLRFVEGENLSDVDVLAAWGVELGFDDEAFRNELESGIMARRAEESRVEARRYSARVRTRGVPVLLLADAHGHLQRLPHEQWLGKPDKVALAAVSLLVFERAS